MANHVNLDAWALEAPDDYLNCRVWQHQWPDYGAVAETGRNLEWTKTCVRCGTNKTLVINRNTGEYDHAMYSYPSGYVIKGVGGLDRKERGQVRMELIRRST